MAKNLTSWSNNDSKQTDVWVTNDVKPVSQWANNDVKPATTWQSQTKNTDVWSINYGARQTYTYNNSFMTYNDVNADYNYLVDNNTLNQKLVTRWALT